MKLKTETILVRNWRKGLQLQIDLLLDFLATCDDFDQRSRILNEIYAIRTKIRPTAHFNVSQLSKPISLTIVTLKSSIDGNSNDIKPEHPTCDKQALDAA